MFRSKADCHSCMLSLRIWPRESFMLFTLKAVTGKAGVRAEQMEISRLRAELAQVTMEREILGNATAYFAKGQN